ncbi:hypothetical protein OSB04_029069 [Centaurea solstitialis]|uniref:ADP-ribosyl cyclase/cyclic ADP-ribose hydrolase n=1 Tax=Centaurea solstitialis TaxID=347529 RepID=A0AA38SHQ6_9ASTR|nr:hypothetical protein OSB04_029069 [Centaurea solstitialis]
MALGGYAIALSVWVAGKAVGLWASTGLFDKSLIACQLLYFLKDPPFLLSTSMASSKWTHDVFLSFRGEDTRTSFVDHLYAALVQRGVNTFKDDEMLRRGELISRELLKAIEGSRFAVVVFSENYANSSWCLDELAKIMECRERMGQKVLPVFYHVDPSDLRSQNFEKFKGEMEKVTKWRVALVTASKISGWHVSKADNIGESKFINKIVHEILGGIEPQRMKTNLIGIESHMDALNSLLCTGATGEVRIIGIWGMGGIGKTTIAQALFRRIAYKFEGSSFVKDVRQNSCSKRDICVLQEKILRDVLISTPKTFIMIRDPDDGVEVMCKTFSNKKVLVVLDDVDNVNQLEFLAGSHEWFGPGSRIIITTRDEHLLADAHFKYKPNCLPIGQAVELFSRHAFKKSNPPMGYEDVSYRAISYTGYLPLALKVLGSFFRGRQASVWESALNRLSRAPNTEIFETMKLSFDGLDVSEKNIFLDIACFFKGKDKEHVTRVLDSFGFEPVIGISVLIEKSLITVSNEKLGMHDLIQEMGWQIVRQSFSDSRLWELEEFHEVRNRQKLKAIEAIVLPENNVRLIPGVTNVLMPNNNIGYDGEELGFSDDVFRKMKNLRLLDVGRTCISCEPTFLPDKLRWLSWHHYPFSSLPVEHLRKLVGLEMFGGPIRDLWKGQKILPNLKFVDLRNTLYLTKFPDVSGAPNIERLILSYCQSLLEVHESLGCHNRLVYLDMSGCQKLKCLPSMIEMDSLETLILSSCLRLERFPEVAPSMVKLSEIYLDDCFRIEELPSSIRYLSGLRVLNLISCQNLKNIPNSICELKNLKSLHLHKCIKLQQLPEKLGNMEKLEELFLGFSDTCIYGNPGKSISCRNLTSLCSLRKLDLSWRPIEEEDYPKDFQAFSSLEELHLSGNSQLTQLPAGISCLSQLKLLEVNNCCRLQNLHALPSKLQVLRARGCSSLEKIGDITQEYQWLYKAWFIGCHKLLEDQESERYIDKMLQQSFLKKCASVGHRLSIAVPGSKIPSWFGEQQHGCNVALRLPPNLHTQVMGFAICGVFHRDWKYDDPRIIFKIVNDEKVIPESLEVDIIASSAADHNCNLWVTYIPFGFFQQMYHDLQPQDWSNIEGNLVMTVMRTEGEKSISCGAKVVYKEDMEPIQQLKSCISDFGKLMQIDGNGYQGEFGYKGKVSANTYVYEEKSDEDSNPMSLRTRASHNRLVYNRPVIYTQLM